ASDFAPRLFDPFSQADSGFSREHGGLGLGLAIARHLVEVHGGTIQAKSEGIGKGATFIVALPVPRVESAAGVKQMPALLAPFDTAAAAGLDGIRVLAVDDDADARAMVREILEAAGAHVTTVDSAESALEEIARVRPDALLADLGMPGVDGFELIARVRSSPDAEIRQVPAAALTAYARPEDRTKALGSGFQIHLAKPIDPAELIAAVALLARPQA